MGEPVKILDLPKDDYFIGQKATNRGREATEVGEIATASLTRPGKRCSRNCRMAEI